MAKDLMVGINIHNCRYAPYHTTMEQNIADCVDLGLKIIRYNNNGYTPDAIAETRKMAKLCHENGMQLMLCIDDNSWQTLDLTLDELETHFEVTMEKLSAELKNEVDVYQVFNESDNKCMGGNIFNITSRPHDGKFLDEYNPELHERCIYAMRGALRGLKKGYADAKTSMNFCWWHTAHVYSLYEHGCRWDVMGLDWYSDCEEVSSIDLIVADVCKNIPDCELMICETNQWMNFHARWDEEKRALIANKETRDALQARWVPSFIQKLYDMEEPRFKAVIFYELLDEPGFEKQAGTHVGESHFGFIECDERGGNRVFKPVFETTKTKIKELGI